MVMMTENMHSSTKNSGKKGTHTREGSARWQRALSHFCSLDGGPLCMFSFVETRSYRNYR